MTTTISRTLFGHLAEVILEGGARKATKYLNPGLTVKATLQGRPKRTGIRKTILFTIGRPNYAERMFIKKCIRAGEPFPVKKIQIVYDRRTP